MTDQQQAVQIRQRAIELFENDHLNVTQLCKMLGRSRTWFYKWKGRLRDLGADGLQNQIRRPCPVNRTPLDIEGQVLAMAEQFPSYGPQRIAHLLHKNGVTIGKTAVHGVLKRNRLNRRKERLEWVRINSGEVIKASDLDTDKQRSKHRHIHADNPGDLVGIDLFYVGCLKGVGRIYQFTACDAASSYAWAKLYTDKSAESAVDFITSITNMTATPNIASVLTDNGKEFTTHWKSKNHDFEKALNNLNIKHRYTKVRHPWTNGFTERLNRNILEEFYQVALRKKIYNTVQELQDDLKQFIAFYNFNRPHQGYRLKGRCPAEAFFQAKRAA